MACRVKSIFRPGLGRATTEYHRAPWVRPPISITAHGYRLIRILHKTRRLIIPVNSTFIFLLTDIHYYVNLDLRSRRINCTYRRIIGRIVATIPRFSRAISLSLLVTIPLAAQLRVDPRHTYYRVMAVVPIVGKGTYDDARRPMYAPPAQLHPSSRKGILAHYFVESDCK
jgi:hypothetical protein